jgi:hypothetical protein
VRDQYETAERGCEIAGPGPVLGRPDIGAASASGDASGRVQEPVARRFGFTGGQFAVEEQVLSPDGQIDRGQRELQPGGIAGNSRTIQVSNRSPATGKSPTPTGSHDPGPSPVTAALEATASHREESTFGRCDGRRASAQGPKAQCRRTPGCPSRSPSPPASTGADGHQPRPTRTSSAGSPRSPDGKRFDLRLQIHPDHRLRDLIGTPSTRAPLPPCFKYLHRFHRPREIAARRQPVQLLTRTVRRR